KDNGVKINKDNINKKKGKFALTLNNSKISAYMGINRRSLYDISVDYFCTHLMFLYLLTIKIDGLKYWDLRNGL
ncbi:MAG: immunoglobulin heavy chain variable domain-containing protein, partial [Mycoplasmataceae bacterium]|nr:immunoglobulin heavy chain variable domain-containing protein [Mycoplasmataceae bacterium]